MSGIMQGIQASNDRAMAIAAARDKKRMEDDVLDLNKRELKLKEDEFNLKGSPDPNIQMFLDIAKQGTKVAEEQSKFKGFALASEQRKNDEIQQSLKRTGQKAMMSLISGQQGDVQGNPIEQPEAQRIVGSIVPQRQQVEMSRSPLDSVNYQSQGALDKMQSVVKEKYGDRYWYNPAERKIEQDPKWKSPQEMGSLEQRKDEKYFKKATGLMDKFDDLSKDYRKIRDSYGRVISAGSDPSAAGDLALIFNYMKILDPGSVVRESEFATAQNSAGVPDRIRGMYNRVLSGQRLAPDQRKDFMDRAKKLYVSQSEIQKSTIDKYTQLAEKFGVDPQDVITDVYDFEEGESKDVSLPEGIETTSQAVEYLKEQGMSEEEAINWIRSQ